MTWRYTSLVAVALLGACGPTPDSKEDSGMVAVEECTTGTPPEITEFTIEDGERTDEGPSLFVELSATDVDGDLTSYQITLWFDSTVDGSVVQGDDNRIDVSPVSLTDAPCAAPEIRSEINIVLLGDDVLAYDSLYEFAGVIVDDSGTESAPAITTAKTPTEE